MQIEQHKNEEYKKRNKVRKKMRSGGGENRIDWGGGHCYAHRGLKASHKLINGGKEKRGRNQVVTGFWQKLPMDGRQLTHREEKVGERGGGYASYCLRLKVVQYAGGDITRSSRKGGQHSIGFEV